MPMPSTTPRTKNTIHLLQDGGPLSVQEYRRIKDKYFRVISGILRYKLSKSAVSNDDIRGMSEEVFDDVFTPANIKEYKWSFQFRQFLYKQITGKFWEKIHELDKKEVLFSTLAGKNKDGKTDPVDFVSLCASLNQPAKKLDESERKDLALTIVKEFILPDLRTKNKLYHQVLHRREIDQRAYPDIAREFKITQANARQCYLRAKKLFVKIFVQYVNQMPFIDETLYDTKRLMTILPLLKKK
ncbi:MAG: hypothetical protein V1701_10780 [Planctomycetota bacterium]